MDIEKEFKIYREMVIPEDACSVQVNETKMAFYAGMMTLLRHIAAAESGQHIGGLLEMASTQCDIFVGVQQKRYDNNSPMDAEDAPLDESLDPLTDIQRR